VNDSTIGQGRRLQGGSQFRPMKTRRPQVAIALALFAAALIVPSTAAAASPLAGWWPMNERSGQKVYDWSGNGNHGQLGSTPQADANDPTWIKGIFNLGSALRFGGDDFVTIPDAPELRPEHVTVSVWFRGESTPGRNRYIVAKGSDRCEAASFALYSSSTEGLGFYVYDGEDWIRSPEAEPTVWDGKWHHAAGTYNGQMVRLFIDGEEVGTGTPTDIPINYDLPSADGLLGAYMSDRCSTFLVGDVDGVSIWNRALPIADIGRVVRAFIGGR
jgi:Concanavalin A-like lectin/glucanases superfamily